MACVAVWVSPVVADPTTPVERVDAVWRLVKSDFFDPDLRGLDWQAIGQRYRARAEKASTDAEVAAVVNAMLGELDTSHTRYFTPEETGFYQLLALFQQFHRDKPVYEERFGEGPVRYTGIGLFTEQVDGSYVATGVLEGQPAAAAGVVRGDVLLEVEGEPFAPVASFVGRAGREVTLVVRRTAEGEPLGLTVTPREIEPQDMFLDAMRASATVHQSAAARVGYVHAWSYAGVAFQELLEELVRFGGALADADALVLDLRGGWGGASAEYLRLFSEDLPVLTMIGRGEAPRHFDSQWRKPVVGLIDGGSRSGKETLAWGFKRYKIGPLVGARTGGAVVAGRSYLLDDGCLLYLAVADVRVDGVRLEGVGVAPDIRVEGVGRYAAGQDPQRDAAIGVAARLTSGARFLDRQAPGHGGGTSSAEQTEDLLQNPDAEPDH